MPLKLAFLRPQSLSRLKLYYSSTIIKNEKSAQRGSFRDGHPADIRGSFARISRRKTSVRVLKILEKNKHLGADIRDPKARTSTTLRDFQKLRSEKLWAEFSFPILPPSRYSLRLRRF